MDYTGKLEHNGRRQLLPRLSLQEVLYSTLPTLGSCMYVCMQLMITSVDAGEGV
jgi:hypothetical protein